MSTGDNFRFLRAWWEIGQQNIGFDYLSVDQARASHQKWFPYMKGGSFRRWLGNQSVIIRFVSGGTNLSMAREDGTASGHRFDNPAYYFRRGITYSYLTSGRFNARLSPGGFIFDVAGSSLFPQQIDLVLAVMNSRFAAYALKMINPTVNFQVGDLARLPIPSLTSDTLHGLVDQAVAKARVEMEEDEKTYHFISPSDWINGLHAMTSRAVDLTEVEGLIDEEIYRLYKISAEDQVTIEEELRNLPAASISSEKDSLSNEQAGELTEDTLAHGIFSRSNLAVRWVSYALGIVLGRFAPGIDEALGRGQFTRDVAASLRALAATGGLIICEGGHSDTVPAKVEQALEVMYDEEQAQQIINMATGSKLLVDYLKGDFFKLHIMQYEKRPVYWLLQSPRRNYSVYIFHERMTEDTLHLLRGTDYVGGAINAARNQQVDLEATLPKAAPGTARKKIEKELAAATALLADLMDFDANLAAVTGATNTRGEVVGWQPEPDDGVLLNLAPLRTLMPSWPNATAKSSELRKAWEALADGDYDWSHTARRYWPDRVEEACRHNKSFAIAHGLPASEESPA